jgi:hypothetical protein
MMEYGAGRERLDEWRSRMNAADAAAFAREYGRANLRDGRERTRSEGARRVRAAVERARARWRTWRSRATRGVAET